MSSLICYYLGSNYGGFIGSLTTIHYEPRQARKGAAVIIDSSVEVWLVTPPPTSETACFL